jgi:hypothetical protein
MLCSPSPVLPEHTMPHLFDFLLLALALTAFYGALGLAAVAFDRAPTLLMRRSRRARPQVFRRLRRRSVRRRRPGAVASDAASAAHAATAGA